MTYQEARLIAWNPSRYDFEDVEEAAAVILCSDDADDEDSERAFALLAPPPAVPAIRFATLH